jgi:DNA-binding response OmpR family regulator
MNFVKKILVVHGDKKARRTLTLLLAGAGYDVRPCERTEVALETAHSEWFDLSLVADPLPEMGSFSFIEALKKLQPSVPIVLLVNQLELPSIIKSIRLAVADVLAPGGDWALVMERINALLRPGETPAQLDLAPEQLAEVETILAKGGDANISTVPFVAELPPEATVLREELLRLARERSDFKKAAERLAQEKTSLEAELKAQLAKHGDVARLQAELAKLRSENEIVAAAQSAVDDKARALAAARKDLERERAALAAERAQGLSAGDAKRLKSTEELTREREMLEDLRLDLRAEDVRLREEAMKARQAQILLESERRQLHEEMDLLREQETNLRAYEQRLRSLSAEVEAVRVHRAAPRPPFDQFQYDALLETAWSKVNRAMDLLEAERRSFTDDKLAFKETLARLEQRAKDIQSQEALLAKHTQDHDAPPPHRPSFTHEPIKAAKAIFTNDKK